MKEGLRVSLLNARRRTCVRIELADSARGREGPRAGTTKVETGGNGGNRGVEEEASGDERQPVPLLPSCREWGTAAGGAGRGGGRARSGQNNVKSALPAPGRNFRQPGPEVRRRRRHPPVLWIIYLRSEK